MTKQCSQSSGNKSSLVNKAGKKHFALQTALMSWVDIFLTYTKKKNQNPLAKHCFPSATFKGRLPFPLAKTYEHKKKAVLIKSGKKAPIKLEISNSMNLSHTPRQSSLATRDQIKILISSLENCCLHLEQMTSSSSPLYHPLSRKPLCQNLHPNHE